MTKLTQHASALGRHGAKKKWASLSSDERKKIMELVRQAKKRRPHMSDNFAVANSVFRRQNQLSREEK